MCDIFCTMNLIRLHNFKSQFKHNSIDQVIHLQLKSHQFNQMYTSNLRGNLNTNNTLYFLCSTTSIPYYQDKKKKKVKTMLLCFVKFNQTRA